MAKEETPKTHSKLYIGLIIGCVGALISIIGLGTSGFIENHGLVDFPWPVLIVIIVEVLLVGIFSLGNTIETREQGEQEGA